MKQCGLNRRPYSISRRIQGAAKRDVERGRRGQIPHGQVYENHLNIGFSCSASHDIVSPVC
jgi:hypothetical protein